MADKVTIIKAMALLTITWPKEPVTLERQRIYEELLADLPDEVLTAAVKRCIAEHKYPTLPTIADIRGRAVEIMAADLQQKSALQAWGEVVGMMRHTKHYWEGGQLRKRPDRLDDLTERCVEAIGGWPYLRMSEDAMSDRARFCEVYATLQNRAVAAVGMLPEVKALTERLSAERQPAQLEAR